LPPEISITRLPRESPDAPLDSGSAPGAALLHGWSDSGGWTICLPWPERIEELSWKDAARWEDRFRQAERALAPADDPWPDCPFLGGWVGFVAYEAGALDEVDVAPASAPPEPPLFLARHSAGLIIDPSGDLHLFAPAGSERRYLSAGIPAAADEPPEEAFRGGTLEDSLDGDRYRDAVTAIREAVRDGEVYQVNLTRRFSVAESASPSRLHAALIHPDPPACSALIRGRGWSVASASPELLLAFDTTTGVAESRPIKGTILRGREDAEEVESLLGSAKDAAEHLMIVDVVRNDLGKVAPPGRVSVSSFRTVRSLSYVHHLESTVRADGLQGRSTAELLRALLPAASITGAPKIAAVRMIHEIEPVARGVYCGTVGFVDRRGRSRWSVAIRTAVVTPRETRYHAGGGIVWDSDPAAEDAESRAKAIPFLRIFGYDRNEPATHSA
jgi:anthranilate/para-aminobenzoate synthase component I